MFKKTLFVVSVIVGLAPLPMTAEGNDAADFVANLEKAALTDRNLSQTLNRMRQSFRQRDLNQTLKQYLVQFHQVSEDGVLTAEILERYQFKVRAADRARSALPYLSIDLNGDGIISASERVQSDPNFAADIDLLFAVGDTNGDGQIGIVELLAFAGTLRARRVPNRSIAVDHFMRFDIDEDGEITPNEVIEALTMIANAGR